jgi:nucleoside 2-deoxyribosyltransferase
MNAVNGAKWWFGQTNFETGFVIANDKPRIFLRNDALLEIKPVVTQITASKMKQHVQLLMI